MLLQTESVIAKQMQDMTPIFMISSTKEEQGNDKFQRVWAGAHEFCFWGPTLHKSSQVFTNQHSSQLIITVLHESSQFSTTHHNAFYIITAFYKS
jgi:hypothetical protein